MSTVNNLQKFLAKIQAGKLPIGCVITFSDPAVSELAADAGMDFLWIDGEHGELDRITAMHHLMAIRGTDCASFYRVPACDHTEIKRIIDFDPAGVIIPMIMNADDARYAVEACRYPLAGNRGCGLRRQYRYGADPLNDAYWERTMREPMVILQIEHIEAVRNLDAILKVPGIGSLLIGPYDLSYSMGKPGQFHDPEVMAAYDTTAKKCREAGILLGVYAEGDFDLWRRRGVQYIASANDTTAIFTHLQHMRQRLEEAWK